MIAGSDFMHARYYSSDLGRFLSVDPVGGKVGSSQSWNRYSYVDNRPTGVVDPDGRDLHIVFDFRKSGLTPMQQGRIAANVAQRYRNAGVDSVRTYFEGSKAGGPSLLTRVKALFDDKTRIVTSNFDNRIKLDDRDGSEVYGENRNPFGSSDTSTTYAGWATGDEPDSTNFLANVGAHETGHSLLYPDYALDRGNAEPGSTMQPVMPQEVLEEEIREFSDEDAAILRERLNENEDQNG